MLVLYYDITVPRAALALLRLEALRASLGAEHRAPAIGFVGLDTLGLEATIPVTLDQMADIAAVRPRALALGLVMRDPTIRPPTTRAHLVGRMAEESGAGSAWRRACLGAYWTHGADLGESDVLAGLARTVGLDGAAVERLLDDRVAVIEERRRMAAVHRRGVGGVPVVEVDGTFVSADLDDAALRDLLALSVATEPDCSGA
jgi:predicted DsbA family dithiol-disulfide isomerase